MKLVSMKHAKSKLAVAGKVVEVDAGGMVDCDDAVAKALMSVGFKKVGAAPQEKKVESKPEKKLFGKKGK